MTYFLFIMDVIPIFFILYLIFVDIKNRKIIKDNHLVMVYGGGFTVRISFHYIIIFYIIISTIFLVLYLANLINISVRPFLIYGLLLPVSVLYYSSTKSIYLGENGVLVGGSYYNWDSNKIKNSLVVKNNKQNNQFPYICEFSFGDKIIKVFIPKNAIKNTNIFNGQIIKE